MKKHKKLGFTLIEVSLFLAVTGLLFMGIIIGTQNALRNQRFYDSTQNFVEFLKNVYSQVSNPQSQGQGNGDLAIYGKLVVFGQNTGLDGTTVNNDSIQRVYVYDIVGDAVGTGSGDVLNMMISLNANVVKPAYGGATVTKLDYAGLVEDYVPRWDAQIEVKGGHTPYKGSILIIRHPSSGTINTLVSDAIVQVNSAVRQANSVLAAGGSYNYKNILKNYLTVSGSFKPREIDFCVNPEGTSAASSLRRNVRLAENARNSSGVMLLDLDGAENRCRN